MPTEAISRPYLRHTLLSLALVAGQSCSDENSNNGGGAGASGATAAGGSAGDSATAAGGSAGNSEMAAGSSGMAGAGGMAGAAGVVGMAGEGGMPDMSGDAGAGDACATYCNRAMTNCAGDNAIYSDLASCLSVCAAMPVGNPDDTAGNTAWCRAYHAGDPASMDPGTHCPHASASGGGVCGERCEAYCDQVLVNCVDANVVYADRAQCLATCAAFPSGGFQDVAGNTVECRTYHASFPAAGDPVTHCRHASASGDGVCGERCEAYCDQALANCGGPNAVYADRAQCLATCAAFPVGGFQDVGGNSVQCRTYHASFPAAGDPTTHCPHASASGDGVCGQPCDAYCDQALANCVGPNAMYANRGQCLTTCVAFPAGGYQDISGNTVQCRTYHASFPSAAAPDTHCPHASASGDNLCGDMCEAYCDQVGTNCDGADTLYPDRITCLSTCAEFPEGGFQDVTGNTVQCRIYHGSFPAAGDPALHCPHASIGGAAQCVDP